MKELGFGRIVFIKGPKGTVTPCHFLFDMNMKKKDIINIQWP